MNAKQITDAAFAVLEQVGLDRLSMRAVAQRLDVQVGGLYYYIPDKDSLLRAMADELTSRVSEPEMTMDTATDAARWCQSIRASIIGCRDGARLLAHSPHLGSRGAIALMERLQSILAPALPAERRAAAADTLLSYLSGFVAQEQRPMAIAAADIPGLLADFPLVAERVMTDGCSDDQLFATSVLAILNGFGLRPAEGA